MSAKVMIPEKVMILDPSEQLRPEAAFAKKPLKAFRDYSIDPNDPIKERVRQTYTQMHTHMTMDFVKQQHKKWCGFNTFKATVMDVIKQLDNLVDESDPDVDVPNIMHSFQTAERIRQEHPDKEWFQLTGLIHDIGKVMAFYNEPQWAVVGDTFPVGCAWADSIVYRDTSFEQNSDGKNPLYSSKYGIYKPNCGLENVIMSWGHDEYLYRQMKHNHASLPEEAFYMIRFHSFYPWHSGGDYMHLCNEKDLEMLPWVLEFNKYDLYTKSEEFPDVEALTPYYQKLIDKYMPGALSW
ncbi:inositol oxygenase [Ischnura elegans]|uniref:inositol oxygenase n=1 Tax=Ischnura elegans TaxID=197161 RepID=UPI001ED8B517|nr:inositol oxygenase [Ischnura elegans]